MNKFNEKEFEELCRRFNVQPCSKEVTIGNLTEGYYKKVKQNVETDRRGEVVFCVIRPSGKAIVITCSEYPQGIFRIPTGGIGHSEDIVEAVYRETKEELGLNAEITDFAGVLKIRFDYSGESVMFYSYMFILKETGGRLLLDASDDEISEVGEVDIEGLKEVVEKLKNIKGDWNDWGRFRYETSNAVLEYLKKDTDRR